MFDRELILSMLTQIDDSIEIIIDRARTIHGADDFTGSARGMERLDSICMRFMAIGETLKRINTITTGSLLSRYPDIDWKGAMGFRDLIAHHYFDIDAEQVSWICTHELGPLSETVKRMIEDLR